MTKYLLLLCIGIFLSPVFAEENDKKGKSGYEKDQGFSGPGLTTEQLEEDDAKKAPFLCLNLLIACSLLV
jgi:hypothetical protein